MAEPFGIAEIDGAGGPELAVRTASGVTPLDALLADGARPDALPARLRGLLPHWEDWCDAIGEAIVAGDGEGGWIAEEQVAFRCPVSDAPTVYCAGANYLDHLRGLGVEQPEAGTDRPFHFLIPPASLTGHRRPVPRPAGFAKLDWEIELAVVIGTEAHCVPAERALEHVCGYTVANDVSARDREQLGHPWFGVCWLLAKGQTGMQPVGPAVVPASFVADPMDLDLELTVNGEVRQRGNTSGMVFSVAEQIAYLSHIAPLLRGDLLLTGTPGGTAAEGGSFLADGDTMSATIEGLGTLTNELSPAR